MQQLKLSLFGRPWLEIDGQTVEISSKKGLALLAYLAATGQRQSRESLATLLWPDHNLTRARANLRRSVWILNKAGLDRWLEVEQDHLAWK
jgi:DNA-binding SARP family transcriptional activator